LSLLLKCNAFRKGNDAFSEKKYDEAISFYTEALKHSPENAVLYSNRWLFFYVVHNIIIIINFNIVLATLQKNNGNLQKLMESPVSPRTRISSKDILE
jgi:hypothetical protein